MSLLIRNASYVVRDAGRVERDADVLIVGDRIAAVGQMAAAANAPDLQVLDGRDKAVIPGLVNAHTHLYQNFLKGLRDDVGLVDWCNATLFPAGYAVHRRHWLGGDETCGYQWAMLSALEMLAGGVTCCVDLHMSMDSVFHAWREVGIRGVAALLVADRWLPGPLRKDPDATRAEALRLATTWHGAHPRLDVVFGPSTPFLCSRELLLWVRDQAAELGIGVQIHLAETRYEVAQVLAETGLTPIAYAHSLGLLGPRTTAVHCVHVTDAEIDLLAETGTTVVHCPKSNLKLGSGIAPIPKMLKRGVTVALAADGAASNDTLDMFEEMRFAALLHKGVNEDPTVITARQAFEMATAGGARAAGLDGGAIDPGRLADLALLRLDRTHLQPLHDLVNTVVYCAKASDVTATIVGGEIVMWDGVIQTVDETAARIAAQAYGAQLYEEGVALWKEVASN
jgi:5-methylthioadenosine/S-adenosylhomocysteine deaminase